MAFFSQTVTVPHGTATVLVSAQATNTIVYVQTATASVTVGDSGVGASGWPLPNFQMSFNLVAGDAIYAFYNNATGSANVQVLVGTVPA